MQSLFGLRPHGSCGHVSKGLAALANTLPAAAGCRLIASPTQRTASTWGARLGRWVELRVRPDPRTGWQAARGGVAVEIGGDHALASCLCRGRIVVNLPNLVRGVPRNPRHPERLLRGGGACSESL